MTALGGSILLFLVLNLLLGSVMIPASDVVEILLGGDGDNHIWRTIVLKSRLPQALTALSLIHI